MKIRLFKPHLGKDELDAVKEVFDKSWIGLGPKVKEFEENWKKYINCKSQLLLIQQLLHYIYH